MSLWRACRGQERTLTHASEGQRAECEVHDHVVGCDSPAGCAVNHPSDKLSNRTKAPGQ